MRRREFITLLGGAVTSPLAARAQQPRHVGAFVAGAATHSLPQAHLMALVQALRQAGWSVGFDENFL
jgi:hypothetical protein